MILAKLRYIITVSILFSISIASYAEFDGRYADLPSHKFPIWLFAIIGLAIIESIVEGISNNKSGKNKKNNQSKDANDTNQKSPARKKVYSTYGLYFDHCTMCGGRGWILDEEEPFWNYMPETEECNECHGFGHILNDEAIKLYTELQQQSIKEKVEAAKRAEKAKEELAKKENEAYEKFALERKDKFNAAIKVVKEASREVLSKSEYKNRMNDIRNERIEISRKMTQLRKAQPLCPKCNGNDKQCNVCHGTGRKSNEEVNKLFSMWKSLKVEYQTLESDFHSIYDNDPSREAFNSIYFQPCNHFEMRYGASEAHGREYNILKNRIREVLKDQPICYHCRGTGSIRIFVDYNNYTYQKQIGCPRCKGAGGFRYD